MIYKNKATVAQFVDSRFFYECISIFEHNIMVL